MNCTESNVDVTKLRNIMITVMDVSTSKASYSLLCATVNISPYIPVPSPPLSFPPLPCPPLPCPPLLFSPLSSPPFPSPSLPSPLPPLSSSPRHSQVNDQCVVTQKVKEDLYNSYPKAKRAHLKDGGNFPYLSRCEEVVLHLQVSQDYLGTRPLSATNNKQTLNALAAVWCDCSMLQCVVGLPLVYTHNYVYDMVIR